jgi:hypothetical protein
MNPLKLSEMQVSYKNIQVHSLPHKRAQIQYHDGYDTTNDWLTPASAITITKSSQESKRAFEKIALYKGSPLFINISRYSQIDLSKSIDSVQH